LQQESISWHKSEPRKKEKRSRAHKGDAFLQKQKRQARKLPTLHVCKERLILRETLLLAKLCQTRGAKR